MYEKSVSNFEKLLGPRKCARMWLVLEAFSFRKLSCSRTAAFIFTEIFAAAAPRPKPKPSGSYTHIYSDIYMRS